MTIETYYNFVKIIECGNILAASQELMIAQPALLFLQRKRPTAVAVR